MATATPTRKKATRIWKPPVPDPAMLRVRQLVKEMDLSLDALAERMGYGPERRANAWQALRSDNPSISTLRRFARALGVPLSKLLS